MAEISVIIKAQDAASAVVAKVAGGFTALQKGADAVSAAYNKSALALGTALIAAERTGNAYLEDEKTQTRLRQSVVSSGLEWEKYGTILEGAAEKGLKLAFADEEVRNALSQGIQVTGSAEKSLKLLSLAQDAARGTGLSLETTMRLVSKITDESIQVFARYGIKLDETMTAAQALSEIERRYAGQAEAYAKSDAGRHEAQMLQLGELQEAVGQKVIPVVANFLSLMQKLPPDMQVAVASMAAFGPATATMASGIISVSSVIMAFIAGTGPLGLLIAGLAVAAGLFAVVTAAPQTVNLANKRADIIKSLNVYGANPDVPAGYTGLPPVKAKPGSEADKTQQREVARLKADLALVDGEIEKSKPKPYEAPPLPDWGAFDWSGFSSGADTAAKKVDILEDGIISYAEALDNNLTPAQAGAMEAAYALSKAQFDAEEAAFDFEKTVNKIAVAFANSQEAGEKMLMVLAKENLEKLKSAQTALFGSPTREVADLGVQLANVNYAIAQATPDDRRAAENVRLRNAQIQEELANIDDRRKLAADAKNEALIGQLDSRRNMLISEKGLLDQGNPVVNNLNHLRDSIQGQIDIYASQTAVAQAQATAADQTLLTQREQLLASVELNSATRDLSGWVRQNVNDFRDLKPELAAFRDGIQRAGAMLSALSGGGGDLALMRP